MLTEVTISGAGSELLAHAMITSVVLADGPRSPSPGLLERLRERRGVVAATGARRAYREHLGIMVEDGSSCCVEIRDDLRNGIGVLHGGVVAGLVDAAATHAAAAAGLTGRSADLLVRYVAPARTGPVRAVAATLGTDPAGNLIRVEVLDAGAGGRLVALATARVVAHPGVTVTASGSSPAAR